MISNGREYTRDELAEAFRVVQNPDHWKGPIDAVIHKDAMDVTNAALIFFAGCVPEFIQAGPGRVRCVAIGYFAAVGA